MENRIDPWLLLAMCGILGASLATLHAISQVIDTELVWRQLVWGGCGLCVVWLISRLHPSVLERLAVAGFMLSLAVLAAVLIFGAERAGTKAWFAFGPLTLQPSEFARIATAMMIAAWLAKKGSSQLDGREVVVLALLLTAPVVLILAQPDLGVAITYAPLLVAALWVGGLANRIWVLLVLLALTGGVVAWHMVLKPYQKERVLTVLDPDRDPYGYGYQVRQSKIAVGSGLALGHGLGRGSQSLLRFLPAQHTDFVFAAWAEATGFAGGTVLMLAYALLIARVSFAGLAAENRFGLIFCTLIASWLAFQVVINLGMVMGWLPTTGVTLPMFSYGGSSLMSTCVALGMVQSVWRHRLVNQ